MTGTEKKLAIFYEHPEWFKPLFTELDRRGVTYDRQLADTHSYDPAARQSPYALIVNRMSPSAHTRSHAGAIFYTLQYLAYLKSIGANVLNGYDAAVYEFSKARQLELFEQLGIPYPRARVINSLTQAPRAAHGLRFPVVLKPNIGGSGAGIVKFDTPAELAESVAGGEFDLGLDHTALVQEYLPARENRIVRVEILNGEFLYAIRLYLNEQATFNLCPADYCDLPENQAYGNSLADGVSGRGLLVEGYRPPAEIITTVRRITSAAHIDVGGVEYLINDRDGQAYFYDVNALSNFVADAPNVVGFDPFPRLVDYLLVRAGILRPATV